MSTVNLVYSNHGKSSNQDINRQCTTIVSHKRNSALAEPGNALRKINLVMDSERYVTSRDSRGINESTHQRFGKQIHNKPFGIVRVIRSKGTG